MKSLWLDFETTGLNPVNYRIVECAIVLCEDGLDDRIFHTYVKYDTYPEDYLADDSRAKQLTGLTPEYLDLKGVPERRFFEGLRWFFDQFINKFDPLDKLVLCGYNVDFDDSFARELFIRYGEKYYGAFIANCRLNVMSSIANATRLGKLPLLRSYRLQAVAKYFNIDFQKAHSAVDDIRVTRELQRRIDCL